jgi:glycosyltransferase involved in cell wall biosynthesis
MTFSVVIPTCDRPRRVTRAVASVAQQRVPADHALEVVVVNDGAPGSVPALDAGDVPLTLVETGSYTGPSRARNRGIEASAGDWVVFLDDDDRFVPSKIEALARVAPQADALCNGARISMVREQVSYAATNTDHDDWYRALLVQNVVGGASRMAARREALLDVGGFRDDIAALEDHELWIRLAQAGARYRALPDLLTLYECVTDQRSVSKEVDKYQRAAHQLHAMYPEGYGQLTEAEWRQHMGWVHGMLAFKCVLNGQRREAATRYLRAFGATRQPRYLATAALALAWPYGLFLARSRMAPR